MTDPIGDAIDAAALTPQEVDNDGTKVVARPLTELIAARNASASAKAMAGGKSAWGCTRPARVVLPDSIGPGNTSGN